MRVAAGATVRDSVIMDNVAVGAGAVVSYSIVAPEVTIGENASVGGARERADGAENIAVIAEGVKIPAGGKVAPGEMISEM